MTTNVDQTNFAAGELAPALKGRADLKNYYQGAETLTNWWPMLEGGIKRRPGSRYIDNFNGSAFQLEEFVFNDDQAYLFVFSTGGTLTVYSLPDVTYVNDFTGGDWTAAMMKQLRCASRGDIMIVTHKDMKPQQITRTGASTFTIGDLAFDQDADTRYQPYYKYMDAAIILTPSATTGVGINLTLSGTGAGTGVNQWTADHVGTVVRYKGKEIGITARTNATVAVGTVRETLADTTGSITWDEQAFSDARGYPRACAFHEERLWFAGLESYPQGVFASKTGDYFNFALDSATATDAIWTAIGGENVAEIRCLVSWQHLLLFADTGEFYVPTDENNPITPSSITFRRASNYGSASVQPIPFDTGVAFVHKTGSAMRELVINDQGAEIDYNANLLSTVATHLINDPTDLAVCNGIDNRAEQLLFVVMTDGTMAVMHSHRAEEVAGWVKWTTDGIYDSVCVVLNQIFVMTRRTINDNTSATSYMLEELDFDYLLDAASLFAGPASGVAGITRVLNKTVHITVGNNYDGTETINGSGDLTLNGSYSNFAYGFNFTPVAKTMPLQVRRGDGLITNKKRRIVRATAVVEDSHHLTVNGRPYEPRLVVTTTYPLEDDRKDFRLKGWDRLGQVTVSQDTPGHLTLLALELEASVS